jgi:hypothetical protein
MMMASTAGTRGRRSKVPSLTRLVRSAFLASLTDRGQAPTLGGSCPGMRQTKASHGLTPGLCPRILPPGESMVVIGAGKAES